MEFSQSPYKIEELEQFRDEKGFINLDKANLIIDSESRNIQGFEERIKNWIDFNGTKVLLKSERKLEGESNYCIYSELIMSELAKQLGIPFAKCDLVKYQNQVGIISYLAFEYNEETLETIHGIIENTATYQGMEDVCDYQEVEEKLARTLRKEFGLPKDEVIKLLLDRRKQQVLKLFAYEADGHLENEAIVIGKPREKNGELVPNVKMAPMFDNEASFLFDCSTSSIEELLNTNSNDNMMTRILRYKYLEIKNGITIEKIARDKEFRDLMISIASLTPEEISKKLAGNNTLREAVSGVAPKVCCLGEEKDDYEYDSMTDKTLAFLLDIEENDEVSEIFDSLIEIDMNRSIG